MAGLESLQNEEPVERDRGLVDDVHALPDSPPSTRFVVTPPEVRSELWNLSEPRILTRSEYNEAEEEAMSANETGRDPFVVAGHPGMGSSPVSASGSVLCITLIALMFRTPIYGVLSTGVLVYRTIFAIRSI